MNIEFLLVAFTFSIIFFLFSFVAPPSKDPLLLLPLLQPTSVFFFGDKILLRKTKTTFSSSLS